VHPLYIIGTDLGADAAVLAAQEDSRIKKIVAIDPLLTTDNVIEAAKKTHSSIWFPFYNTVMFWWYQMNSGYAPNYIELENIQAVNCTTILLMHTNNQATEKLKEISDSSVLHVETYKSLNVENIITFLLN